MPNKYILIYTYITIFTDVVFYYVYLQITYTNWVTDGKKRKDILTDSENYPITAVITANNTQRISQYIDISLF